jgi:hypothetical protein
MDKLLTMKKDMKPEYNGVMVPLLLYLFLLKLGLFLEKTLNIYKLLIKLLNSLSKMESLLKEWVFVMEPLVIFI